MEKLTINQTIEILEELKSNGISGDTVLEIPTTDKGIGPTPTRYITGIGEGFDWNAGKIFIYLDQPILTKK